MCTFAAHEMDKHWVLVGTVVTLISMQIASP